MATQRWKVGTVVVATHAMVDWGHEGAPRITAKPGELGIVFEDCGNGDEVLFSGGRFTSFEGDGVVMYTGTVVGIVDPPEDAPRTIYGHGLRGEEA